MNFSSNFVQRLVVGSCFAVLFSLLIYLSHLPLFQPLFVLVVVLVISGALWEYYKIAKTSGHKPAEFIGLIGSALYLYVLYWGMNAPQGIEWSVMVLGLTFFLAFLYYFISGVSPLVNLAVSIFGIVYLTIPMSSLILIDIEYGRFWMMYLLLVAKSTDVGAYFAGKQWGRHKLAPIVSPKKTWEGAIAGFLSGVLISFLLHQLSIAYYGEPLFASAWQSLGVGAIMAIIAQVGDLFESLLKRDSGVKDSNSLPGLGGLLDMVDSLVFTAPLLYFFLRIYLN